MSQREVRQVDRCTHWQSSDPALDDLWRRCVVTALNDFGYSNMDGRVVAMGPPWLRDHVHELKAYKYFLTDLTSGLEFFFRHRLPDGHYPDFFVPIGDQHQKFVAPEWEVEDHAENRVFIRIPCEADLEYLAVEGVYQAWKATGDDRWLAAQIPILEQGLRVLTSHPKRWNKQRGLVMRPFTPDTWDFINFYDADDHFKTNCEIRRFDDTIPFCIFHGDNSGLYAACSQMAEMLSALHENDKASEWRKLGNGVRDRANKLLFGDGFYVHQFHLNPSLEKVHNERARLSLSNTYDINRGLPTHEMAVRIIDSFRKRWDETKPKYVGEWFTIEPPYEPRFGWYVPGEYVNGGLFGAVAGELAKAAFNHGREEYAFDILKRFGRFVQEKGEVPFMCWPDGRSYGGGPAGWSAAAVVSAMMESLAGIEDLAMRFRSVRLSPKWAAGGTESAEIRACYPASGEGFAYSYRQAGQQVRLKCSGSGGKLSVRLLMPKGREPKTVTWDGKPARFTFSRIENSRYLEFDAPSQNGELLVRL